MKEKGKKLLLSLVFIGLGGLIHEPLQAQAQTKEPSKIGLLQVDNFMYASPNPKGSFYETRLKFGLNTSYQLTHTFRLYLNSNFWGQTPKETSYSFIDVESAFLEWKMYEKTTDLTLQVGRILPNWGSVYPYSPIRQIFPSFSLDPLESRPSGMAGFYGKIQESRMDFEILASPLFIPNLGGASYKVSDSGELNSPSRWVLPIYKIAQVGTAKVPLTYKIHVPSAKDVVLKAGGAARLSFKDFYDQYRLSASIFHVVDPKPRLKIDGKLAIQAQSQSHMSGEIDIIPQFYRQTVYALEAHLTGGYWLDVHAESAFRNPENPSDLREDMIAPQEWKNFIAFQTKHQKFLWPQALFGLSLTRQWDAYIDPNYKLPTPASSHFFGKFDWKPFSKISFFTSSEVSTSLNEYFSRYGVEWAPFKALSFLGGIDFVSGENDTYWGFLRNNDRMWIRGVYEF